jgi:hypothetical protein
MRHQHSFGFFRQVAVPPLELKQTNHLENFAMADVAILGTTGQEVAVRIASRSAANLQRCFGDPVFEKVAADVLDADAARRRRLPGLRLSRLASRSDAPASRRRAEHCAR